MFNVECWVFDVFPIQICRVRFVFVRSGEAALYLTTHVVHFSAMVFTRRNMDWWCERGILTLVLAALIFAPLAFGAVYAWSFLVVQSSSSSTRLLSNGESGPPCGVPSTLGLTSPSSITPAFKNARMSFNNRLSSTRLAIAPISLS